METRARRLAAVRLSSRDVSGVLLWPFKYVGV